MVPLNRLVKKEKIFCKWTMSPSQENGRNKGQRKREKITSFILHYNVSMSPSG